jgi:hypothetical protein
MILKMNTDWISLIQNSWDQKYFEFGSSVDVGLFAYKWDNLEMGPKFESEIHLIFLKAILHKVHCTYVWNYQNEISYY